MNNSSSGGTSAGERIGGAPGNSTAAASNMDSVSLLTQEAQLTAPDSVLEPNVLDVLKEYLKAGGKVQTAVQDLSDGYMGYAGMADLIVEWGELVDMPIALTLAGGSGGASAAGAAGAGGSGGSFSRAYSGLHRGPLAASGSVLSAVVGDGSAAGGLAGGDGGAHLDVLLLQELVKERFDPKKFLSVFKKGHPEWLDRLIQQPSNRKMVYELSAANKNSLLLNYAIQRILKLGYEDEVAQVGSSLASYFDVYHRLLASRLAAAARATDTQQLRSIAGEIVKSSIDNQHTYVHAQQLLTALSQLPGGGVFRRLSQEVERAAAERHGGIKVYQLQPLLVPRSASAMECKAVQLVADALVKSAPNLPGSGPTSVGPEGQQGQGGQGGRRGMEFVQEQLAAAEAPLVSLQRLYQQEGQLSVQPLRHPRMMQLLLSGMYIASDARPSAMSDQTCSMRELCIRLLALAVAGRAQQGHHPQQQQQDGQDQQQQQQPQQQQGQCDPNTQRRSLSPEVKVHGGVEAVAQRLREALLLTKRMASSKLTPADLDSASQVSRLPVAALGLLQNSQHSLGHEELYSEERLIVVLPNHLSVLHRVACEQPGMIPQVLRVLRTALGLLGTNHELIKAVLAFLVSLIVSGAAWPTLELVQDFAKGADPSLIRHFILLVLESVAPPYSEAFARTVLVLMEHSHFARIKEGHSQLVREFALGCRDIPFRPPLANALQTLLDVLS